MNRPCKNATRPRPDLTAGGPVESQGAAGPSQHDGRANLGSRLPTTRNRNTK